MASSFAAVFIAIYVAHYIGDHWIQTHNQAIHKGNTGIHSGRGRLAVSGHVLTYILTSFLLLGIVWWQFSLGLSWSNVLFGQAINAITHWLIDRRWTLKWLADRIGKSEFMNLGGPLGGSLLLDQSAHFTCLFIVALIIT